MASKIPQPRPGAWSPRTLEEVFWETHFPWPLPFATEKVMLCPPPNDLLTSELRFSLTGDKSHRNKKPVQRLRAPFPPATYTETAGRTESRLGGLSQAEGGQRQRGPTPHAAPGSTRVAWSHRHPKAAGPGQRVECGAHERTGIPRGRGHGRQGAAPEPSAPPRPSPSGPRPRCPPSKRAG